MKKFELSGGRTAFQCEWCGSVSFDKKRVQLHEKVCDWKYDEETDD